MRIVIIILGVAAVVGLTWVFTLPDKAECVATGRVVDPTERHCQDATGYVQLREHALFHTRDVALATGVLLAVGYAVYRVARRRSRPPAPSA